MNEPYRHHLSLHAVLLMEEFLSQVLAVRRCGTLGSNFPGGGGKADGHYQRASFATQPY